MFKYEINKILIKKKGIILLLLFLFIETIFICFDGYHTTESIQNNENAYISYVNKFHGKLTKEKKRDIDKVYEESYNSKFYLRELENDFKSKKINQNEYNERRSSLFKKNKNSLVFKQFYKQVNYVEQKPTERYIIDERGWNKLLEVEHINILELILIISIVIPIFSQEYETEMDNILLSSYNGRKNTFFSKMATGLLLSVFIIVSFSCLRYLYLYIQTGLNYGNYPIQSLEAFSESTFNISLMQCFLLQLLLHVIGGVLLVSLISFINILLKKSSVTYFVILLVILLPMLIWGPDDRDILYRLPLPTALLAPMFFFTGAIKNIQLEANGLENVTIYSGYDCNKLVYYVSFCIIIIILLIYISKKLYLHKRLFRINRKVSIMICLMLLMTGCTNKKIINNKVYKSSQCISNDKYIAEVVDLDQITLTNKRTKEKIDLIKNPFFDRSIDSMFMDDKNCYYSTSNGTNVYIYKIDLRNFKETLLYNNKLENNQDFFGMYKKTMVIQDNNPIISFYIIDDNLYYVTDKYIYYVNLSTKKRKLLSSDVLNVVPYLYKDKLIYVNCNYQIVLYDLNTNKSELIEDSYTEEFEINNDKIIFKELYSNKKKEILLNG